MSWYDVTAVAVCTLVFGRAGFISAAVGIAAAYYSQSV